MSGTHVTSIGLLIALLALAPSVAAFGLGPLRVDLDVGASALGQGVAVSTPDNGAILPDASVDAAARHADVSGSGLAGTILKTLGATPAADASAPATTPAPSSGTTNGHGDLTPASTTRGGSASGGNGNGAGLTGTGSSTAPAAAASGALSSPPWAVAFVAIGCALVILIARGQLAKIRGRIATIGVQVVLVTLLIVLGAELAMADLFVPVSASIMDAWMMASVVAWIALVLAAASLTSVGRAGRAARRIAHDATVA